MMFSHTCVAKVGLPKGVWEPLRKLRDNYDIPIDYLASAWGISEGAMLKVIYAARLQNLENGEEIEPALFLESLVGEMTHD